MANNSNLGDADLVPELGDEIKIIGKTGKIYGVIVYRSERMIRVRPFSSKTEIYEFPLDENGEYLPELGITETQLDPEKKARDPHFSKQMEVFPQSIVEFYDREGRTSRKVVQSVVATASEDGLIFNDGSSMNFQFTGLPEPYITFLDVTNLDEEEVAATNEAEHMVPEEPVATIVDDEDFIAKLLEQQGDIIQDETAQINKPYSEDSQRQDMFVSVMQIIAPKPEQQKNPRILRKAYILTDLLASLKRSVVQLSEQGQPLLNTSKSYLTETLDDILKHAIPPTILPIVDLRKTLYTAEETWGTPSVEFVAEPTALLDVEEAREAFANAVNAPRRTTNAFETYIQSISESFKVYGVQQAADFEFPQQQNTIEILRGTPNAAVAGYDELGIDAIPTSETATDIAPILARILDKGKTFFDPVANKTATLQLADTGKHVGNIVLSPELAYTRNAASSSVLLWDMHASEWCRNRRTGFVIRMNESDTSQVFLGKSIDMTVRDLLRSRLQPSLSFMSWANAVIMDSIGLRALEITKDQMNEICKKMKEGQTNWDLAMVDLKQKAIEHMSNGSTYAIRPIVAIKDSNLYSDAIKTDAAFSKFIDVYTNKETSLAEYDIALASAIADISQGTLLSYWSALVSQVSYEHIHESRQAYVQETERQLRKVETERERKRRFVAAPIINKCPHVRDYDVVNAIKNDSERMKSLEGFVKKYNGGMQNNFVKCNKCLQNLVCKHELLLLQEFKMQDQSTTIHKQLVLDFGGSVFMGSYICKNCGQKISNLEFDTHLEFDDEGRPLVGRAVLVPEEGDAMEDEEATKAEHDARVAYITDSSKDLQRDFVLYQSLRRVFEDAHIVLSDETAKVLLEELKLYLNTLMSKDKYEAIRKKMPAAKLPPYDIFYNQQLIGALAALAIIELQCLPTDIPIPNRGCPYSRSGFPIDYIDGVPSGTTVDMGAIHYIECVIAQISSGEPPWNSVLWAAQGIKEDARKGLIHDSVLASLTAMRGVDKTFAAKPQIPKLTDAQTQRLRAAVQARTHKPVVTKNEDGDRIVVAKLSDLDRLPSQFHPCPRYERTPTTDVIPLGNAEQFAANIESKPVPNIKPIVAERIQQLQQDIMYQINQDMNATQANRTFVMEDVGRTGLGYRAAKVSQAELAEYETMRQAYAYVDRRDPARPNTGTHMYVPWVAPETEVAEATPDESIYYKLFSKVCATGEHMGISHEFTYGNICRYCGFHLYDALLYETMSEIPPSAKDVNDRLAAQAQIRKAAVEDACRAIGVEINERTFFELRAAINIKKQVAVVQRTEGNRLLERIAALGGFLQTPTAQDDLRVLVTGMQRILDPKGDGSQPPLVGNARYEPMRLFYERLDTRRAALVKLIAEKGSRGLRTAAQQMDYVDTQLKQFDTLASNIRGGECLRSAKRMFIINSRFLRASTKPVVHMARWVPSIIKSHIEEINKRMEALHNVSNVFEKQVELVKDPENPEGIDFLYTQMNAMCENLGGLLRYWEQTIRPNQVFAVQERINEYTDVLRWAIYSVFLTFFGSDPNPDLLAAKQLMADWILFTISHEYKTYEVYNKTPEEIRARMNDRREREKAEKIEKQDKVDDKEIRKLMRIATKLGYGEDAILRKTGYSADAEKVRFQELQALGIAGDVNERGAVPHGDEGMGDVRDEDGDA